MSKSFDEILANITTAVGAGAELASTGIDLYKSTKDTINGVTKSKGNSARSNWRGYKKGSHVVAHVFGAETIEVAGRLIRINDERVVIDTGNGMPSIPTHLAIITIIKDKA